MDVSLTIYRGACALVVAIALLTAVMTPSRAPSTGEGAAEALAGVQTSRTSVAGVN